jgi:HD-GYP domain-containing protein (c-di-GMP phosphodiesterase class II)
MSGPLPGHDERLMHELLGGFSAQRAAGQSVGIVGAEVRPAQPPRHCRVSCLGNDPETIATHGCRFLGAAAQNQVDVGALTDGRCARGFEVAAQPILLSGEAAVLITVAGALPESASPAPTDLLEHLQAVGQVVERVDQVLAENAGFAEEVLRNYEQLNLIFDLTQQVAQLTDVLAIERLLIQRVGQLLSAEYVYLFAHDGDLRVFVTAHQAAPEPLPPPDVAGMLEYVRQARQAQVKDLRGRQIIAGPLARLDAHVDVVVAVRPPGRPAYTSGDMMMVESILTFGGQIISNCELHERLRRMSMEVTRALVAAIDKKDHYTSGHSERGGFLTLLTARELGLPASEQQSMEWAGLLHDVGKIGIPEEILCKPGRLTPEEFEVIKQHPRMGYEILQPIASLGTVLDGVLYHHEYPDGTGYPTGLAGDQIPLVARIIHVVDTFDALTSTRSYRQAFTVEKAFEIIRSEKGTRIDGEVAEAFFRAFQRYRTEHSDDFARRFPHLLELEVSYAGS